MNQNYYMYQNDVTVWTTIAQMVKFYYDSLRGKMIILNPPYHIIMSKCHHSPWDTGYNPACGPPKLPACLRPLGRILSRILRDWGVILYKNVLMSILVLLNQCNTAVTAQNLALHSQCILMQEVSQTMIPKCAVWTYRLYP